MKDNKHNDIRLTYIEKNKHYNSKIDREWFLNQMEHIVNWYPGYNDNAQFLCKILPEVDSITINKDILDTQDVPFFVYQNIGEDTQKCMKLIRSCKIIWSMFLYQCDLAKTNAFFEEHANDF